MSNPATPTGSGSGFGMGSPRSEASYPLPAYLNFAPGGISYANTSDEADLKANEYLLQNYSQSPPPTQPPAPGTPRSSRRSGQAPDVLVHKAKLADDKLRLYTLLHGNQDTSLPHFLPSLSVLAGAAFGRLTGVPASSAKVWADAMVLQYLEDDDHSSKNDAPTSHADVQNAGEAPMKTIQDTTADVLRRIKTEQDASAANQVDLNSPNYRARPCGYVFKRGDIAWNCRTCQTDSTCVICDSCFRDSNHQGHEVYFHRTTPGGCCDCGDAEAWKSEGCCDSHRPRGDAIAQESGDDPEEAVRMSQRGRQEGIETLQNESTALPPRFAAALGVVIGAAVNSLVQAIDGAGIGADPCQWQIRWAEEATKIHNKAPNAEDYYVRKTEMTPHSFSQGTTQPLPENYRLSLRLHNDDVHTFDEVIEALHEPRHARRIPDENPSLVTLREDASEMTHHVDADGQVTVKPYAAIDAAMQGFRRLKSRGLHCAVVSTAQVDLEHRAKALCSWLGEVSAAHPAAAVLVVHALVQVGVSGESLAGVSVWPEPRTIPVWASLASEEKRFQAFPPHLASSYLSTEDAEKLHRAALEVNEPGFLELTGTDPGFYGAVPFRLPSERYRKSPHALWGTLPSVYTDSVPLAEKHPLLLRLSSGKSDASTMSIASKLTETVFVVDTDLRKQQEADRTTASVFPHKLPGLNLISGVGRLRLRHVSKDHPPFPNPMEHRHLLATSSFRAPISPILLLLLLDPYPTKQLRGAIHALFLSLLTDARFKCRFAAALGIAYRPLSTLFCAGVGTEADSPLGFTVQIFTAGSLVRALGNASAIEKLLIPDDGNYNSEREASIGVFAMPIAQTVIRCIHTNLLGATKEVNMILKNTTAGNVDNSDSESNQNANDGLLPALTYVAGEHPLITPLPAAPDDGFLDSRSTRHKRLPHLLRDLEYVIETPGTAMRLLLPQRFPWYQGPALSSRGDEILTFSAAWSRLLRLAQGMDPQKRKISGGHVEYEQNRWLEAFGLSLNFAGTRDALAESPTNSSSSVLAPVSEDGSHLISIRDAMGNVLASLLREMKLWLYREGMLETGLPVPPGGAHGAIDISQVEALQRSTLHVSASRRPVSSDDASSPTSNVSTLALSCATGVKMTEAQLDLIEGSLLVGTDIGSLSADAVSGAVMGDLLRVPHSPLAGDSLSFHLPLHRALARSVRSMCGVVVPESVRRDDSSSWWKLPVLDDTNGVEAIGNAINHPLVPVIKPTLRSSNCRVVWAAGPDCSPEEAQQRRSRSRRVSAYIAVAKIIHSLADHPMRCLAAAQQIERHLWARNGSSTAGMALNYSSTPLCRSFRDLDLSLVQLSASGMSVGLGAKSVFSLLLSRFSMDGYLCDPERRNQGGSGTYGRGFGTWVNPPRLQDPDHAVVLSESFFSTLCVLVSELPAPPPISSSDDSSLRQSIKRELLHALAAEPRSHSAAMAAASCAISKRDESDGSAGTSGGGGLFRDVFADVLKEVGKQKSQGSSRAASGPPAFELKPECCDEYDPTFFHLRRQEHQHAMDIVANLRKQKMSKNKDVNCFPLVCPPPKAHPRFLPCRLLLHLPAMDGAIRRALLFALTGGSWLPPPEPSKEKEEEDQNPVESSAGAVTTSTGTAGSSGDVPVVTFNRRASRGSSITDSDDSPPFSAEVVAASSVSFLEVLQLLTLQIHTLEEAASLHRAQPDLDPESRSLSSSISVNSFLGRLVKVPESLMDVWALLPYPDGPLKSSGSGENRGSVLGLLIALYEHRADHGAGVASGGGQEQGSDGHGGARSLAADGLKWLLRFVSSLVDGAPSVALAVESATSGVPVNSSTRSPGTDSTMADWAIDDNVQSTISGMLKNLPDLWPKPEEEKTDKASAADEMKKERGKEAQRRMLERMKQKQAAFQATVAPTPEADTKAENDEEDLCIICRCDDADGENNGPLGFLGHVQRSRLVQMRASTEAIGRSSSDKESQSLFQSYRVVGHMGCQVSWIDTRAWKQQQWHPSPSNYLCFVVTQLRETEAMDSKAIECLPRGSIVTVTENTISDKLDILSRRVFVKHVSEDKKTTTEGWASVRSSQGYIILSPLATLCYENSRWGSTRPIIRQCGHAAHLRCVETHTLSLHQRAAGDQPYDGRFAANIDDGEFLCPLCKQLSNILIPRDGCALARDRNMEVAATETPMNISDPEKALTSLLTQATIMTKEHYNSLSDIGAKALTDFGNHLMQAMDVPWERSRSSRKRRHRGWHPAIQRWDYEEEADDDMEVSNSRPNVRSVLRLLRQQHIAWAAVGHSAAAAEASSRGIEEILPFGSFSKTEDPWQSYAESKDNDPMTLELKRTLSGTSGLLEVLLFEMASQLKIDPSSLPDGSKMSIVGRLLSDIVCGHSWAMSIGEGSTSNANLILWSQLTSFLSAMPCHVARDGMLSESHEARAAAASMWAVRGLSSKGELANEPPAPFSVQAIFSSTSPRPPDVPENWGTMAPVVDVLEPESSSSAPFRPAVASAFLYSPLLSWDLNTLSGAVLSTILLNNTSSLPGSGDLLNTARILIVGRLIQSAVTPEGFECPSAMEFDEEDEEGRWGPDEMKSQGQSLVKLVNHCRSRVKSKSLATDTGMISCKDSSPPVNMFASLGRAILPFSRSLILMLRACSAAINTRRQRSTGAVDGASGDDKMLEEVLEGSETMTSSDGWYILKALGGPLPSALIDESGPWWPLINRWITAAVAHEAHHGSRGHTMIPQISQDAGGDTTMIPAEELPVQTAAATDTSSEDLLPSNYSSLSAAESEESQDEQMEVEEPTVHRGDPGFEEDETDEELIDEEMELDEAEEMVEFPAQIGLVRGRHSNNAHDDESIGDQCSSGSDGDGNQRNHNELLFANVAKFPILSYQPSLLAVGKIGPGRHNSAFEFASASAVMSDLSHLGLIHQKGMSTVVVSVSAIYCSVCSSLSFIDSFY